MYPLNSKLRPGGNLAELEFYLFAGPGAEGAEGKVAGSDAILDGVTAARASPDKVAFVVVFEHESVAEAFRFYHLPVQRFRALTLSGSSLFVKFTNLPYEVHVAHDYKRVHVVNLLTRAPCELIPQYDPHLPVVKFFIK